MRHKIQFGILLLFLTLSRAGSEPAPGPKANTPRPLPGTAMSLTTRDGWRLSAAYSPARGDNWTFILLHSARGRSQDWYPLVRAMGAKGIGVLALDLRGHAQSQNPPEGAAGSWPKFRVSKDYNEWENMRQDVAAAVAFLVSQNVPADKIALGGSEVGGSIALKYAAAQPEVPMFFWLSPGMSYRDVLTVNAMRAYANRPILLVVADEDKRSVTETPILHEFAKRSAGEERTTLLRVSKGHGTQMLTANRGLIEQILDWVENPIRAPELIDISTDTALGGPGASGLPTDQQLDELYGGQAPQVR